MQIYNTVARRRVISVLATGALGALAAATIALPTASAQPQCTAAGLTNAIGTVSSQTAQYLSSHPDANDAISNAGAQGPGADNAIRAYFVTRPQQWADLQRIAQPLRTLRQQCDVDVAPTDIARLFDAMAS
ncbi:MAG: hemophore-related protein [Mycobacterium sp.]